MSVRNPKSNSELVPIAKVGRPHGLRGAFFVSGREDLIPSAYGEIYIGLTPQEARPGKILGSLWQSQRPVLKCSLASDRTQAELLTNQTIFILESRLRQVAGPSGILWRDLEGAQVLDSDGVFLGVISQVYNSGASDIVEVQAEPRSSKEAGSRRIVDIPLIGDYIDLTQCLDLGPPVVLRLKVPGVLFEDLWQEMT